MANKTCGECKHFFLNSEGHCKSNDGSENAHNDACSFFEQKVITNGDRITASPEVLAEPLVFWGVWWMDEPFYKFFAL